MPFPQPTKKHWESKRVRPSASDLEYLFTRVCGTGEIVFEYGYLEEGGRLVFRFEAQCPDRTLRFDLGLPDPELSKYRYTTRNREISENSRRDLWNDDVEKLLRLFFGHLKDNLAAADAGAISFAVWSLPHIVLPQYNHTVAQWALPIVERTLAEQKGKTNVRQGNATIQRPRR